MKIDQTIKNNYDYIRHKNIIVSTKTKCTVGECFDLGKDCRFPKCSVYNEAFKSINAAKRKSRELQGTGKTLMLYKSNNTKAELMQEKAVKQWIKQEQPGLGL